MRKLPGHPSPENFVTSISAGRRVVRVSSQPIGQSKPRFDPDREAARLYRECRKLLRQIARSRLNIRLLRAALNGLQIVSSYKANRRH